MRASRQLPALAPLILLACSAGPGEAEPTEEASCARYADRPDIHAYCVRREAAHHGAAEAGALCDTLRPEAASECRKAWVEERIHAPNATPRDVLLAMCGGSADCGFNVIELYPEADALAQIELCRTVAGPFTADCVGHTLQRWQLSEPPEASVAPLVAATLDWPERLGHFVGLLRFCQGRRVPEKPTYADAAAAGCPEDSTTALRCLEAIRQAASMPVQCSRPPAPSEPPQPSATAPPPPPRFTPPPR